jgi:hypothetical protein
MAGKKDIRSAFPAQATGYVLSTVIQQLTSLKILFIASVI